MEAWVISMNASQKALIALIIVAACGALYAGFSLAERKEEQKAGKFVQVDIEEPETGSELCGPYSLLATVRNNNDYPVSHVSFYVRASLPVDVYSRPLEKKGQKTKIGKVIKSMSIHQECIKSPDIKRVLHVDLIEYSATKVKAKRD